MSFGDYVVLGGGGGGGVVQCDRKVKLGTALSSKRSNISLTGHSV